MASSNGSENSRIVETLELSLGIVCVSAHIVSKRHTPPTIMRLMPSQMTTLRFTAKCSPSQHRRLGRDTGHLLRDAQRTPRILEGHLRVVPGAGSFEIKVVGEQLLEFHSHLRSFAVVEMNVS